MRRSQTPRLDYKAFTHLYEQTHLNIYRYIYSLRGGPTEEVEDLTSETYSKAWKARSQFAGNQRAATAWLITIAKRLVIDTYRRESIRGYQIDIEDITLPNNELPHEEKLLYTEKVTILLRLLQELPMEKKEIIVLRYILGWRVKDIGKYLDIAENTVSATISRSLKQLKKKWLGHQGYE